jgi:hypothetical protein
MNGHRGLSLQYIVVHREAPSGHKRRTVAQGKKTKRAGTTLINIPSEWMPANPRNYPGRIVLNSLLEELT